VLATAECALLPLRSEPSYTVDAEGMEFDRDSLVYHNSSEWSESAWPRDENLGVAIFVSYRPNFANESRLLRENREADHGTFFEFNITPMSSPNVGLCQAVDYWNAQHLPSLLSL
jgi:hypothetical protein